MSITPDPTATCVLRAPLDLRIPDRLHTATFALGWFWGSDAQFGSLEAVKRTRVGYCGGATPSPDYHHIGDHTESVQVDYDPRECSYRDLLVEFAKGHDVFERPGSRQYMSAVFYHDEDQHRVAHAFLRQLDEGRAQAVQTVIAPVGTFTLAEDYHQKYYLRRVPELMEPFVKGCADQAMLLASTAAARLNGLMGGYGLDRLEELLPDLGLTPRGRSLLERLHARPVELST